MALITEVDVDLSHLVGEWGPDAAPTRPAGLHVTSIIRAALKLAGNKKKWKDDDLMTDEERHTAQVRWEMGFAWEQVFEAVLAPRMFSRRQVVRQEPLQVEGIWLSPDAMSVIDWTLEEYKLTWRSMSSVSDLEGEFDSWFMQIKAYCYALKTFKARLFVFFVNGNYRGSGPTVRRFDITFTPQELKSNWAMILNNRELVEI